MILPIVYFLGLYVALHQQDFDGEVRPHIDDFGWETKLDTNQPYFLHTTGGPVYTVLEIGTNRPCLVFQGSQIPFKDLKFRSSKSLTRSGSL